MENCEFYEMIFKRKSFHLFKNLDDTISQDELNKIQEAFVTFNPLIAGIGVKMKIVENEKTTCKRGQEYCILLYSEIKEGYLMNIGYLGEQLDLYLASLDIGELWYGIGKVEQATLNDLQFVIMIAIHKAKKENFRKDMFKSKRKALEEIWEGSKYLEIASIVRFCPSACNTQPWFVEEKDHQLHVYRYKKPGKRGIMPADKVVYYNRIDIGIFLFFIDCCLEKNRIPYERIIDTYDTDENIEKVKIATYFLGGER